MMIKVDDIPQDEVENLDFVIHHNYAGHNDYESSMRIEVVASDDTFDFLSHLAELRMRQPDFKIDMAEIDISKEKKMGQVIKLLIYQGFLLVDN